MLKFPILQIFERKKKKGGWFGQKKLKKQKEIEVFNLYES